MTIEQFVNYYKEMREERGEELLKKMQYDGSCFYGAYGGKDLDFQTTSKGVTINTLGETGRKFYKWEEVMPYIRGEVQISLW